MSAPLIWIGIPAVAALVLWFLQPRGRLVMGLAGAVCITLALLAWQAPLGALARLGPLTFEVNTSLLILGRKFVLDAGDRSFLVLTFSAGAIWFLGAESARVNRFFIPAGMILLAMLVSAQAVEPFLYAAPLIEIGVLITIPGLVSARSTRSRGVQRFLVFQTFALPFVLLAGWLAGIVTGGSSPVLSQAALFLAMGLALWLAVFPLNTWIPQLVSEAHPYVAGFILTILPTAVFFLTINFLDSFNWLRTNPAFPAFLKVGGIVTVVTSGIWAAYQKDMRRLMAYGFIFENSFFILALSLDSKVAVQLFNLNFIPRLMGFALWSLSLAIMERYGVPLTLEGVKGVISKLPFAGLGLLIATFSATGLPLSASFAVRQAIIGNITIGAEPVVFWIYAGVAGFAVGAIRLLLSLVNSSQSGVTVSESRYEIVLLSVGMVALLILGIIPR